VGIIATIKNYLADALGATRTRVDHFTADVEHRMFRLLAMLMWSAVAFVCLSLGLTLAMLTVEFGFDLPPKYALGIPALLFLAVAPSRLSCSVSEGVAQAREEAPRPLVHARSRFRSTAR
jgi:hypothetical protein